MSWKLFYTVIVNLQITSPPLTSMLYYEHGNCWFVREGIRKEIKSKCWNFLFFKIPGLNLVNENQ